MALKIKQLAFFGDSYCHDSKQNFDSRIWNGTDLSSFTMTQQRSTYIDRLSKQLQLPVVHFGRSGHGPMWTVHELLDWCENNKSDVAQTYFIFCWSDIKRQLVKTWKNDPSKESGMHPGETPLLGSVVPALREGEVDPRYVQALELYYLYLHNDTELERRGRIVYHALENIFRKYHITENQRQEYYCFDHTLWLNNKRLPFEYDGVEWECLYFFAQHFSDYGVQGVDDLEYLNHFSKNGHEAFAHLLKKRYEEHISKRV